MQDLTLTLVQNELFWEDSDKNLAAFDRIMQDINEKTDLIILPEMFNTGFSINPENIAQKPKGIAFAWMQEKAKLFDAALCGSILTLENGNYYNRLYWVFPDGNHQQYDKKHLFRLGKEWQIFSPGNQKVIIDYQGWKISPLVCYDLRFPVWSKNRLIDGRHEYDLLIYVANWPAVRRYAWKQLLIARSLENMAYTVGVNRVGQDGHGINHSGDSMLVDAKGQILAQGSDYHKEVLTITISKTELGEFREKFPFSLDWDDFEIKG